MKIKPDHKPDIHLLLDHFKPSERDEQARSDLLDRLFEILNERFGSGFDVEYVGIGRYAADIKQAPFEIAIVDVQSELGIVGSDYSSDLPDIYSPSAVARTLAREGFRGWISSHSLSRTTTRKLPATQVYVRFPQTEDPEDQRWLQFSHTPRRGLIYPERLHIRHPVAFDLILPGPTTIPLVRILEEYSRLVPAFRDLVSISYIWCHSLGVKEISPTCVALLFVSFLQATAGLPGITFPTGGIDDHDVKQYCLSRTGGKWAVHKVLSGNGQWKDELVTLDTHFVIKTQADPKYVDLEKSQLLRDFMAFLNRTFKTCRTSVISVAAGGIILRDTVQYLGSMVKSLPDLLNNSAESPYSEMRPPQLWKIHPLVIQDPFMYTHNHAEFVSIQTVDALAHNSWVAVGKMNAGKSLVDILGFEAVGPTEALWEALMLPDQTNPIRPHVRLARSTTIRKVQDLIHQNYGTGYRVELFGSTAYGVDNPTSDLDLVIVDTNRMDGFSPNLDLNNLPPIYNVKNIGQIMRAGRFANVLPIPSANVPIVKFKDPDTGLECDINVNDQLGFINTSMIRHYVSLQPVLIPLLRLIKRWAKSVGLNSPSKRPVSFSSYALTLMTLAWFQSLGWLPNLQEDISTASVSPTDYFWIKNRKGERFRCDTRFKTVENWTVDTNSSAEILFFEWLGFWGRDFDYDKSIACVRRGGIHPRKGKNARRNPNTVASPSKQTEEHESSEDEPDEEADEVVPDESFNADWSRDIMCVADPFIVAKNCAGPIKKFIFTRFVQECRNTEGMLQLGVSLETILSREAPDWKSSSGRPGRAKKGKKQAKKDQANQPKERRVQAERPKRRPRHGPSQSGAQGGSSNNQNGRGGNRGAQTRIPANNS